MKFIGMGALVVDYYYQNKKFLGRMNGKSWENIIINLHSLGANTKIYGTVGKDETGVFALTNLEKLGIEREIIKNEQKTNRIYSIDGKYTKEYEGIKYWKEDKTNYPMEAEKEDIVIVDNMTENTLQNLDKVACEKVLDLGNARNLIYLTQEKITELLKNFTVINMNEKAYKIIKNKLKENPQELCNLFDLKLLIVTFGKKGILFATKNLEKKFLIEKPYEEVDENGAGDAFFSIILNEYVKEHRVIDEKFFAVCFQKGNEYVYKVLNTMGAIGHIIELQK